ncbi:MAG TPA: C39 family peptidase [Thermoflexales bacterium]|nr:C39 family peptidase [Thermoflexales bacterium]HQW34195.1 C39 family peptidase [Thermoflexales bacterium]
MMPEVCVFVRKLIGFFLLGLMALLIWQRDAILDELRALRPLPQSAVSMDGASKVVVRYYPTETPVLPLTRAPSPAAAIANAATATKLIPTNTPTPAPDNALIRGLILQRQTFNNCGPATLSMQLAAFGSRDNQYRVAQTLRPDKDDRNVSLDEMAAYARSKGLNARVVQGGDLELLRGLIAKGLPVIIETWFIPQPNDEMGHYRLAMGFTRAKTTDEFVFFDSYEGENVRMPAQEIDALWKAFNRAMLVVWSPTQDGDVRALLGERMNDAPMRQRALAVARAEAAANPKDKFAWFNVGTNLLALGDGAGAAQAYDRARAIGLPWRMMWYQFGPYAAYYAAQRYDDVIQLANETLKSVNNLEESYYWRGVAHAAKDDAEAARADLQKAISLNANYEAARNALEKLAR